MTTSEPDIEQLARRFPLVPRSRPALLPLPQQLAEIADLARTPRDHPDADSRIAAAHNKAALVASNFGHPDLARNLCWQHHHRYTDRRPWNAREARLALEPLVNLARLSIRAGRPDTAIAALEALLAAASDGSTADVDGHPIDLGPTIATREDRAATRRWLWTVTLTEGIRALTRTGRFDDALAHAERHHGIGATLLDGRQIAVLAQRIRGCCRVAAALLADSNIDAGWQAIAAHALDMLIYASIPRAQQRCLDQPSLLHLLEPSEGTFGWEVLLCAVELGDDRERSDALSALTRSAAATTNAAFARIVLTHPAARHLPGAVLDHLAAVWELAVPAMPTSRLGDALFSALNDRSFAA